MGKANFIATVIRFMKLFLRGTALMVKDFNLLVKSRGWSSAGNCERSITKRVLIDWSILDSVMLAFNGVDVTAPAKYPHVGCCNAQVDSSFWGGGYWVHGHHDNVVWKDKGLTLFDSEELEAKGKANVSTTFVEALGLRFFLQRLAARFAGKFFHVELDNQGLIAMLLGEKTKSEQVLPILIDIVSIIVEYALKPKFLAIPSEEMTFADPLSRVSIPIKGKKYLKEFKEAKRQWKRRNTPFELPSPSPPLLPKARLIPKLWKEANEKFALKAPPHLHEHYKHSAHVSSNKRTRS